ncbi:MAG: O-antigen ligase family protein [Methylococcaceae bacterium]
MARQIQSRLWEYGGFFTAALMVSIYFSTALTTIVTVIVAILWVFSAQFLYLPETLKKNPVLLWSVLLFLCFMLGLSYSSAEDGEAFSMLRKYRKLLFIPVLFSFLTTPRHRQWVWGSFIVISIITLLGSYLMEAGFLEPGKHGGFGFKSRITHSIFIAFFAFFCIHKLYEDKKFSKIYVALFLLCVYNLFFIVDGRTGQLTIVALVLLFALQRLPYRVQLSTFIAVIAFLTLFLTFSDKASRISESVTSTQDYLKPFPEKSDPSELRYTYWKYSLELIAKKPLLGYGTGSFAKEYQKLVKDKRLITRNPHNEFLMISVQLGLVGLLIYTGFLVSQYFCAKKLPDKEKWLAQGLLLSLIVTSLFNSPFLDHTEGHWFAIMIALCFASLQADDKTETNYA